MAVMGRKKKAVAQRWNAINKQRDEAIKEKSEEWKKKQKKEVTEEEHKRRIEKLKKMGLLKDG